MPKPLFERREPKILVRQKAKIKKFELPEASLLFKCGVVNLDKPSPMLSKKASRKVKNMLEVWKSGHAGTLDPNVNGVLPIMLAKARKLTGILSKAGKEYRCWLRIHKNASDKEVKKAIRKFTGKIKQLPPKISAVKRVVREREVYYVKWVKRKRNTIELLIGCEAGTYIRKWCHDLGENLGTGAHMAKLIRTKAASFELKNSIDLGEIKENYKKYLKTSEPKYVHKIIKPIEDVVDFLPKIWVDDQVLPRLKNGSPVFAPGVLQVEDDIKKEDTVACFTTKSKLASIGFAKMSAKEMTKKPNGMAVKTDIVML